MMKSIPFLASALATCVVVAACGETSATTAVALPAPTGPSAALPQAVAAASDPAGTYRRTEPTGGTLTVTPEGDQWRV